MASRAQQKEAARVARLEAEQQAAAQSARRQRIGAAAGIVIVAIVVLVVVIAVSSGGSSSKPKVPTTPGAARALYESVNRELAGIPQSGATLGSPNAKVTIQYFGDLECPVCKDFTLGTSGGGLPQLISGPVRSGQIKLVYRSLETASGSVNNDRWVPQQVAAYAAGKQGLFWQYAELFYHEQGSETSPYVTDGFLDGLARTIPTLKLGQWQQDRKDPSLVAQVQADGQAGGKDGIQGTPTLVAIGPKAERIVPAPSGIPSYADIMSAVKAVS